ncbi:MAG: YncE family protein [Burkholderiales bacterium]
MTMLRIAVVLAVALFGQAAQALPVVEKTLTLGNNTAGIATEPSSGQLYVTNFDDGTVSIVDMRTLTVLSTEQVGSNPRRIAVDAAHRRGWLVRSTTPGWLFTGHTSGGDDIPAIAVGDNPRTLGSNFPMGRVYVANVDSKTVSVVDATTSKVVATLAVGGGAGAPVSNFRLKKAYVPNSADGTVSVIDETALTVKTIAVGAGPQYAAVDGMHAKVYVNNVTDKTISVIDSTTDTVIKTIPSGAGTTANFGVVSPVYRRYYLPNQLDNTLTIVDTDTDTVIRTLAVGTSPRDVLPEAVGGDVYVVNQGSNSVSVVNAATETVVGSFAVGGSPWRMIDGLGHLFVLNGNGNAPDSLTIATENNSIRNTAVATEFYHKAFDHYFHTADEVETRLLLDGLFRDDWLRSFQFFRVWTAPGTGRMPVSRFFSTQWSPKSSHFYTANQDERNKLVSGAIPGWQLEADAVYYIVLADGNGNCPAGAVALYRMYNDGQGGAPNHRLTTDRATRDALRAQGWTPEGQGPDAVYGCVPSLTGG